MANSIYFSQNYNRSFSDFLKSQMEKDLWNRINRGDIVSEETLDEVISLLVGFEPFITQPNRSCSIFILAVKRGHTPLVEKLIKYAADKNLLEDRVLEEQITSDGCTALHIAAARGHTEIIRILLDAGASLFSTDKQGFSPLAMAVSQKNLDAVNAILEKLQEFPQEIRCQVLEQKNGSERMTALHMTSLLEKREIAFSLLQAGASLFSLSNHNFSPLAAAAYYGNIKVIGVFLLYAKKQNILEIVLQTENEEQYTPQDIAASRGHLEVSNILRQARFHVRSPSMFPFPSAALSLPELEQEETEGCGVYYN